MKKVKRWEMNKVKGWEVAFVINRGKNSSRKFTLFYRSFTLGRNLDLVLVNIKFI
jgi:hypothetical protein